MGRYNNKYARLRSLWTKHKLGVRLKVLVIIVAVVFLITPLRNQVVPGWPKVFRELSTIKIAYIHLHDLLFYVDRSPYTGTCDFVHKRLEKMKMPVLDKMPFYKPEDFQKFSENTKPTLDAASAAILDNYQPSLTAREQQMMLYNMLSATQALSAFKISYFAAEGTLIGYWRHHGMIPWDDDVDLYIDSEKWPLARQVLSCLPNLQLNMGSDYMWKLFHKDSNNWEGEDYIKFPFIDVFLYRNDSSHVWPLTIWLKTTLIAPFDLVFPTVKGIFEGFPIEIPHKTGESLHLEYGSSVMHDCYSRTFKRRERYLVPLPERTHLPCTILENFFPFVSRKRIDKWSHTVLEERKIGSKVLSTFNTSFKGTE